MYRWEAEACQPPSSLFFSYTLRDSPDGVKSFLSGYAQFGVTGPWAPDFAPKATSTPAQTWAYAPLTMSGVVLAYRMYQPLPDGTQGPQITNLTLTPDEIAGIFNGTLNGLGTDPVAVCLNPGVRLPNQVNAYARAEYSAQNWVFSSWLGRASSAWQQGASEFFPGRGPTLVTGSTAVGIDALTNPSNPTFAGAGSIALMDSSTAAYYGLPTVNIHYGDCVSGQTVTSVSATAATIAAAENEATLNSDGTVTPSNSDQAAWPMLMPTYMMVPTNNIDPLTGREIASFLQFAVSSQQTLPGGYVPLTGAMVLKSIAAAQAIPQAAAAQSSQATATARTTASASGPPLVPSLSSTLPAHVRPQLPAISRTEQGRSAASPLLLAQDPARVLLPVFAGIGTACLLMGGAAEVAGRRRAALAALATRMRRLPRP
jgi:phosphate transport system substrate-binding protein